MSTETSLALSREAALDLGTLYEHGDDAVKDYAKALYWYRVAYDAGDFQAAGNLALMYQNGEGVEKNTDEAAYWSREAARLEGAKAHQNVNAANVQLLKLPPHLLFVAIGAVSLGGVLLIVIIVVSLVFFLGNAKPSLPPIPKD